MAETSTLKPKWQLILGLLPSLNTAVIAVVTAGLSIGGTLATQRITAPKPAALVIPAADKPTSAVTVALSQVMGRLDTIEGHGSLCIDGVQALRKDWKVPRAAVKAKQAAVK